MSDETPTQGWDAIELALRGIYGAQEPLHWAPQLHYALGGKDPLDGISAYRHQGPNPHWHFVTFGFSELYAKENADPKVSGYGFELTFRLRCDSFEEPPPNWVFSFLQNLARYVFSSGNIFEPGDHMDLNGPIALGVETGIRAMAVSSDPELPGVDTPNGHLDFLQVIGITLEELAAIKAWQADRFLELIRPKLPFGATDLQRKSLADEPEIAPLLEAGIRRDGSSTAILFVSAAAWVIDRGFLRTTKLHITLGAKGIRDFKAILPGRLAHGRRLMVASKQGTLVFDPGEECGWTPGQDNQVTIRLTAAVARELAESIAPIAGTYAVPTFRQLVVIVVKSEIRDAAGNVAETIG
jgi:hypothetical protein